MLRHRRLLGEDEGGGIAVEEAGNRGVRVGRKWRVMKEGKKVPIEDRRRENPKGGERPPLPPPLLGWKTLGGGRGRRKDRGVAARVGEVLRFHLLVLPISENSVSFIRRNLMPPPPLGI